jgi:hypothetical protein
MEPGSESVTRTVAIDGAFLGDVLLYLRRDAAAPVLRWTLGERGTAEIDACFDTCETGWKAAARLWNPNGLAVAAAVVYAEAARSDEIALTLEPTLPPQGWGDRAEPFTALAECALDELAEELLWQASRAGLTPRR